MTPFIGIVKQKNPAQGRVSKSLIDKYFLCRRSVSSTAGYFALKIIEAHYALSAVDVMQPSQVAEAIHAV